MLRLRTPGCPLALGRGASKFPSNFHRCGRCTSGFECWVRPFRFEVLGWQLPSQVYRQEAVYPGRFGTVVISPLSPVAWWAAETASVVVMNHYGRSNGPRWTPSDDGCDLGRAQGEVLRSFAGRACRVLAVNGAGLFWEEARRFALPTH